MRFRTVRQRFGFGAGTKRAATRKTKDDTVYYLNCAIETRLYHWTSFNRLLFALANTKIATEWRAHRNTLLIDEEFKRRLLLFNFINETAMRKSFRQRIHLHSLILHPLSAALKLTLVIAPVFRSPSKQRKRTALWVACANVWSYRMWIECLCAKSNGQSKWTNG